MWRTFCLLILICACCCAKPITDKSASAALDDIQLIHPHVISLERFQSLLRRADEIFRPLILTQESVDNQSNEPNENVSSPQEYMQPPSGRPFDYYQPLFENYDALKSDPKSQHLEYITPPPLPSADLNENINYYAVKPKKLPKKFDNSVKQVNMKWLNAFEKAASSGAMGELPQALYLVNDERNRINFDDTFFAVDMNVKVPDNDLRKDITENAPESRRPAEANTYLEDLMAVAAAQMPQISPN